MRINTHVISSDYKSRKLWIFLIAFFISVALLLADKLLGAEWVDFAQWALLTYVGGNVGEHFSQRPSKQHF